MRTTIRFSVGHSLKVAVRGDEAYSVFVLKNGGGCSGGPGTPCDRRELVTISYGINTFVQSGHHHAKFEPGKF